MSGAISMPTTATPWLPGPSALSKGSKLEVRGRGSMSSSSTPVVSAEDKTSLAVPKDHRPPPSATVPTAGQRPKKKVQFSQQKTLYFLSTRPPSKTIRPLTTLRVTADNCRDTIDNGGWLSDIEGMRRSPFCRLDFLCEKAISKKHPSSDILFPLESDSVAPPEHILEGEIAVFNLDYAKEVRVHYSFDEAWQRRGVARAEYCSSIATLRIDKFRFHLALPETEEIGLTIQLAIEYRVAGAVYWDNFDGSNYRFGLQKILMDCFEEELIGDVHVTDSELSPRPSPEARTQSIPIPNRHQHLIYRHWEEFGSSGQPSPNRAFIFSAPVAALGPRLSPAVSRIPPASWSHYPSTSQSHFYPSPKVC